jgi:hypothetical protein
MESAPSPPRRRIYLMDYDSYIRDVLNYDAETGIIYYDEGVHGKKKGTIAGSFNQGYVKIKLARRHFMGHRIAWFLYYGNWPKSVLDHINGNRSDNRISNLRETTVRGNNQNRQEHRNGKVSGVCFRKQGHTWEACIWIDGRKKYLGRYGKKENAIEAYLRAEVEARMKGEGK